MKKEENTQKTRQETQNTQETKQETRQETQNTRQKMNLQQETKQETQNTQETRQETQNTQETKQETTRLICNRLNTHTNLYATLAKNVFCVYSRLIDCPPLYICVKDDEITIDQKTISMSHLFFKIGLFNTNPTKFVQQFECKTKIYDSKPFFPAQNQFGEEKEEETKSLLSRKLWPCFSND